jgi:hypothetical protein
MADDLATVLREQRLRTLALADQIGEDRWRQPLLPGGRTLHDQLTHILAWDEWAVGAFEISAVRPLPSSLVRALRDSDEYNARTEQRYRRISRDDVMAALQGMVDRVIISAMRSAPSGQPWDERRIPDLAGGRIVVEAQSGIPVAASASGPAVSEILRRLLDHERAHADEISEIFGIQPNVERFTQSSGDRGNE